MTLFGEQLLSAPMAEISTPPLRSLMRSFHPDLLVCSEMLSAHLILHGGKINNALLAREPGEKIIYQILGNNPDEMRDAAAYLESLSPWGIDINMGCSAPEILKSRSGGYLLKEPDTARTIIRACRRAVKGRLSVKIRVGFEKADQQFAEGFCRMIADEGADFVTIHPRYAKQIFKASACWTITEEIAQSLPIPVVGNGDITDAETALSRLGSCSAIMIGRTAVQKPWIFADIAARISGKGAAMAIDLGDCASRLLDGIRDLLPEEIHKSRAQRFLFYFTKNFRFGHPLFTAIRNEREIGRMKTLVEEYLGRNPDERFVQITGVRAR